VTALDASTIGLQIALPLALITLLALAPLRSKVGLVAQITCTWLVLVCLLLVCVWIIPPWWTPYLYLLFWLTLVLLQAPRQLISYPWLPERVPGWAGLAIFAGLALAGSLLLTHALQGRRAPAANMLVNIAFPMGPGTYLVANGGSNRMMNAHLKTLDPQTDRQAAYRGQSYAVDFIKLGTLGLRAPGWRPTDPSTYVIFDEPVYAPCEGTVIRTEDGRPDMAVPRVDRSRLEGNHVVIQCGDFAVLLAHLRYGSIRVTAGERVVTGRQIGNAGNSGQTAEPHLHIHVQRLPDSGPLLSGTPLHLTFDGEFPVRNDRIVIVDTPMAKETLPR
jgi:hypothetical protein